MWNWAANQSSWRVSFDVRAHSRPCPRMPVCMPAVEAELAAARWRLDDLAAAEERQQRQQPAGQQAASPPTMKQGRRRLVHELRAAAGRVPPGAAPGVPVPPALQPVRQKRPSQAAWQAQLQRSTGAGALERLWALVQLHAAMCMSLSQGLTFCGSSSAFCSALSPAICADAEEISRRQAAWQASHIKPGGRLTTPEEVRGLLCSMPAGVGLRELEG